MHLSVGFIKHFFKGTFFGDRCKGQSEGKTTHPGAPFGNPLPWVSGRNGAVESRLPVSAVEHDLRRTESGGLLRVEFLHLSEDPTCTDQHGSTKLNSLKCALSWNCTRPVVFVEVAERMWIPA